MIPETYTEYTNYMLIQRIMCLEHQVADKMTPRDEFAKAAMAPTMSGNLTWEQQAEAAYKYADAMMLEREARRGD